MWEFEKHDIVQNTHYNTKHRFLYLNPAEDSRYSCVWDKGSIRQLVTTSLSICYDPALDSFVRYRIGRQLYEGTCTKIDRAMYELRYTVRNSLSGTIHYIGVDELKFIATPMIKMRDSLEDWFLT